MRGRFASWAWTTGPPRPAASPPCTSTAQSSTLAQQGIVCVCVRGRGGGELQHVLHQYQHQHRHQHPARWPAAHPCPTQLHSSPQRMPSAAPPCTVGGRCRLLAVQHHLPLAQHVVLHRRAHLHGMCVRVPGTMDHVGPKGRATIHHHDHRELTSTNIPAGGHV
jgi:hypothetical protein